MGASGLHGAQWLTLLLLALVAVFAVVAQRLKTPYPIVLVIAGLLVSLLPHVPHVVLDPEVVFLVFLPPLLYAAASQTSWREFRHRLVTIMLLAVGLVGFTVLCVALFSDHVVAALDWKSGFVLGAVLSTTDAIAAAAIASRVGLPAPVVEILEGESLLNDATGLLALEFGLQMLNTGQTPTFVPGLLRLLWLAIGGVGVGVAVGMVVAWCERWVDDGPVEMVISLVVPYVAYLVGEEARASGVLAVVACGLYLGGRHAVLFSPSTRLALRNGWKSLDFVLNGVVFLLIGLQLPYVLGRIRGLGPGMLLKYGIGFSVVLITLRLLWVFPASWLAYAVRRYVLHRRVHRPVAREVFVVGWTGMRGVVSLAAALSLPEVLSGDRPFTQRSLIVFLTFFVILVTLVGQGLTLPWVIRRLGLAGGKSRTEEFVARKRMLEEGIHYLEGEGGGGGRRRESADDLLRGFRNRLRSVERGLRDQGARMQVSERHEGDPSLLLTDVVRRQREVAVAMRDNGEIGDAVLDRLLEELDLAEVRELIRH